MYHHMKGTRNKTTYRYIQMAKVNMISMNPGTRNLADRIYEMAVAEMIPLSLAEIRSTLLAEGLITYVQVAEVDRALSSDDRFARWGKSDYWRLKEWGDFEGNLYPFLIDKTKEVLDGARRPLHYKEIARQISRRENIELSQEQLKGALDDYIPKDIHQKHGMYWTGQKDEFGALTVSDAVLKCVADSVSLLTLEEIYRRVSGRLPDFNVKKKTISGILSRNSEFKHLLGAFWGMADWDDVKVAEMLKSTRRRGLSHVMKAAELKDGVFRVTAELHQFLPGKDEDLYIESRNERLPVPCRYKHGKGYISGLAPIYRREGLKAGETVRFFVLDMDEHVYRIEGEKEEPGVHVRTRTRWARTVPSIRALSSRAELPEIILEKMVNEGSEPGRSLILFSPRFLPGGPLFALKSERRVVIHADGPLDELLAGCYSELPGGQEVSEAGQAVLDKTRKRICSLYEMDALCEKCGSHLIAVRTSFGRLSASTICVGCDDTSRPSRLSHKLTPADLKRMAKIEERPIESWHPVDIGKGENFLDCFTRRSIMSQSILFTQIQKVEKENVRSMLLLCFFEANMVHKRLRSRLSANYWISEQNPWFNFSRELKGIRRDLHRISSKEFYFLRAGRVDEVLDGNATYAWSDGLDGLPEASVDNAIVMLPYNGMQPVPISERVCAAWLGREKGLGTVPGGSYRAYFEEVRRVIMQGGTLYVIVDEDTGMPGTLINIDHLLRETGFEYAGTMPEMDPDELSDGKTAQFTGPEVLVYKVEESS